MKRCARVRPSEFGHPARRRRHDDGNDPRGIRLLGGGGAEPEAAKRYQRAKQCHHGSCPRCRSLLIPPLQGEGGPPSAARRVGWGPYQQTKRQAKRHPPPGALRAPPSPASGGGIDGGLLAFAQSIRIFAVLPNPFERGTRAPGSRSQLRRHHHRCRPSRAHSRRLSRQGRARHPAGGAAPRLRRRARDQRSHCARLLSQPPLDQPFQYQRSALVPGPGVSPRASATSRRARVRPGAPGWHARWCSAATSKRASPMSRASRRRMRRPFASGTGGPRRSRRRFSSPSATRSRCQKPSAKRCCRARRSGREFLEITRRQPLEVVQELFENEKVRLLFLFKISLFGTWLVDTLSNTSPMGAVIRAFDLESGYQVCVGGAFSLARGLMETFISAGGRYQPQVEIERILVRGRPRRRHRARRRPHGTGTAVRGETLDVHQTFEQLIGREQWPEPFRRKLDGFQSTAWALYGLHLALHESPRFTAARFDPNINRALKWSIGAETMEDLFAAHQRRAGRPHADAHPVRLRNAKSARSDPGAARQAHHLCLARDALRPGNRRPQHRRIRGGIRGQDDRDLRALLPQHDAVQHHRRATSIPRATTRAS